MQPTGPLQGIPRRGWSRGLENVEGGWGWGGPFFLLETSLALATGSWQDVPVFGCDFPFLGSGFCIFPVCAILSRIRTGSLFYMPQSRECDLHQNPPTGLRYFNNLDLKAGAGCTRKCEPSSSLVHLVHIQMVRSELTRRIAQERANTILIFYDAF